MKGMRTKGADFNTDFGDAKPQDGPELPLARIQDSAFDKKTAGPDLPISEKIKRGELPQGYEITADDVGKPLDISNNFGDVIDADVGKKVYLKDYGMVMESKEQMEARKAKESQSSKKTAAIFDGFAHRVTIESKAGDTNETYSTVLNMLSAADIRYREVRRYTVDPDRVMLDILVNKEDVDVIKELNKESKKDNITFTFNDNISEGVQPKVITTPEKDVEEKVTASKKKIAVKVGDEIRITSDNENYNEFRDKTWTVEKVSYNTEDHPGYDTSMEGEALIDAEELPYSLYEYEFEIVKEASKEESN